MLTRTALHCAFGKIRRFWGDGAGVAAVEFALILPFMLMVLVGSAELSRAVDTWRKTTLLARTVADLTSQGDKQNPISSSLMSDILAASTLVVRPFNGSDAKIVVSALSVDITKSLIHPVVCSSVASSNAQALVRPTGVANDLSPPPGFGVNGARYVLAEVSMPYTPMLGTSLLKLVSTGSITLPANFAWPTRGGQAYNSTSTEVILPGGAQCS